MAWQHADAEFTLAIEVEEALGAVDVVEGGEGGDRAIYRHGVAPQLPPPGQEQPVRIGSRHEHPLITRNVTEVPQ